MDYPAGFRGDSTKPEQQQRDTLVNRRRIPGLILESQLINQEWTCNQCPKMFPTQLVALRHLSRVHIEGIEDEPEPCKKSLKSKPTKPRSGGGEKKKNDFACAACGKEFKYIKSLEVHARGCVPEIKCRHCDKVFHVRNKNQSRFKRDIRLHEEKCALKRQVHNPKQCRHCGRKFDRKWSCDKHERESCPKSSKKSRSSRVSRRRRKEEEEELEEELEDLGVVEQSLHQGEDEILGMEMQVEEDDEQEPPHHLDGEVEEVVEEEVEDTNFDEDLGQEGFS